MGMPKQGTRSIAVGNKVYRWSVKETNVPDHKDKKELSITVQENVKSPGNVMQFRACHGAPITPKVIRHQVRQAIREGWVPEKRGGAFVLPGVFHTIGYTSYDR